MRKKIVFGAGGAAVLLALVVYGLRLTSADNEPTIAELAAIAQNAPDAVERERATVALGRRGTEAVPHLRELARNADTAQVRAAAMHGLGMQWDFESMDTLLDGMEDDSPVVRSRAAGAVARMLSRNRRFDAYGQEKDRARIVGFYRTDWEQLRDSPYFDRYRTEVQESE